MDDLIFRTEDFRQDEIVKYYYDASSERKIIESLKSRSPVVLVGSRGVGKSLLLRVAEQELSDQFEKDRVFPIYISFSRSSLIQTEDGRQFHHWMLARLCARIIRSLKQAGLMTSLKGGSSILAGERLTSLEKEKFRIEEIVEEFEASWENENGRVSLSGLPDIEDFKEAIEDLCCELKIKRFCILFDEAAHIFIPEQQRQFFTLFRDLRTPYLSCNAAVYPGVTFFGDTFQIEHDASFIHIERDIQSPDYIETMREIVAMQADSNLMRNISQNSANFSVLAYASNGNPRVLLKTIARASKLNSTQVNEVIREYYRTEVWSEHTDLADKYPGHRIFVDWGRDFAESVVVPDLKEKNDRSRSAGGKTSCSFWIHRDCPKSVSEALRLLAYTGIVSVDAKGIKASRGEVGTRYSVSPGCLFALESNPVGSALQIAKEFSPKRMSEFGANHGSYQKLTEQISVSVHENISDLLKRQLEKGLDVLDITSWQKAQLRALGLLTVGDVLKVTETMLKRRQYVGDKRARQMRNAALAAVYEYLSG